MFSSSLFLHCKGLIESDRHVHSQFYCLCRRILDDLSQTADALKTTVASDPLVSAAATVQAQVQAQQALLQQASLSNPSLLPLLQGLQQNSSSNISINNASDAALASQLAAAAMMLPGGQLNPHTVSFGREWSSDCQKCVTLVLVVKSL